MEEAKKSQKKQENPFLSLAFNIFLPVMVLQKGTKHLGDNGALWALLIALAFPLIYGIHDYLTRKNKNFISIIGIISVLFTGGLALLQADGVWFAVVEMALPLILGIAVLFSAFSSSPFIEKMIYNDMVMEVERIKNILIENGKSPEFRQLLKMSTLLLSASFFLSAALNFILGSMIFVSIDPSLPELQRADILNQQIADMRTKSIFVISIPLMVFSMGILWHLIRGIKRLTGLELEQIIRQK